MYRLDHVLRDYAWGSTTALPELLGVPATGGPLAELWLGGHPDSPAGVQGEAGVVPLDRFVADEPSTTLGAASLERFGDRLPYLLKLLAADQALSLQVHPTSARAAEGFAEEEQAGVPKDARERRYKDPYHKPEMVVAVTEFHALCGLRPVEDTLALLQSLDVDHPGADELLRVLDQDDESVALRTAFDFLLGSDVDAPGLVDALEQACRARLDADPIGRFGEVEATTIELARQYPGDPGVAVSLLLNRVTLEPGEALFLPAGNVHAYLAGTAIEVMATSDNVVRAGLTPKYVDVPELMAVVEFTPQAVPYVRPDVDGAVHRYRPDVPEFELMVVVGTEADGSDAVLPETGPRIALCLRGGATLATGTEKLDLARGESAFVPAADGPLAVSGGGTVVVATVRADAV